MSKPTVYQFNQPFSPTVLITQTRSKNLISQSGPDLGMARMCHCTGPPPIRGQYQKKIKKRLISQRALQTQPRWLDLERWSWTTSNYKSQPSECEGISK